MKRIIAVLLAVLLVAGLCACGKDPNPTNLGTQPTNTVPTQPTQTTPPTSDGKVDYTVTVVDQNGAPVVGAVIQLCKDVLCQPNATNESGKAVWHTAEDSYKVSFIQLPAGYSYADETVDFYFDGDAKEMTITLVKGE